jgi:hypothetical protein
MRELTPMALDRSSERDSIGRSSPKGCSRLARPPRTSVLGGLTGSRWSNWSLIVELALPQMSFILNLSLNSVIEFKIQIVIKFNYQNILYV